jgi:periplasmic protein TonB
MADQNSSRAFFRRILGGVAAVVLIGAFIWFVGKMTSLKSTKAERQVQTVQIIRPPPPPPPPPEQPPPPPPEKVEQPLPKDTPEQKPDEPDQQPPDTLANDGPATAGGDAFGMHQGPGGGVIGGNGTAPFAWYTNRVRDAIKERLAGAPCVKSAKGSISTQVVVAPDGHVKQVKLTTSTGNARLDECVDKALASITNVGDPPAGMPEAVNLRVVF